MHLRFAMHNTKLPSASEIKDSALRNTELQRNLFKMHRNGDKCFWIDELHWLRNIIAFAKKNDN